MGVPKFFRWLSERYPLINQRFHSPSPLLEEQAKEEAKKKKKREKQKQKHGSDSDSDSDSDHNSSSNHNNNDNTPKLTVDFSNDPCNKDPLKDATLAPEIDRLYIDMNGIIHGCSHNNAEDDGSETDISHEQIVQNVCYYLDRIVGTMVQPRELVYLAIDGVAPRAKLNQQRSRRYRSGTAGQELEQSIYEAHLKTLEQQRHEQQVADELEDVSDEQAAVFLSSRIMDPDNDDPITRSSGMSAHAMLYQEKLAEKNAAGSTSGVVLTEVEPGRYTGKFETHLGGGGDKATTLSSQFLEVDDLGDEFDPTTTSDTTTTETTPKFHSNVITPGTEFFEFFHSQLQAFLQDKMTNDPKWKHLTIILSGPNVPGEGEHKIMDFMRSQRQRKDYNPNLRHCIQGQDGDLIMLSLVTHEPNLVLLREQVIFDYLRRQHLEGMGVDGYVHNPNFEFLHMNILRDYLAFDFETSNVVADSPFDLERTIDDFVFMTFFVGNDFLPAMPALDIADEAFDLLWYTYREHREKWQEEAKETGLDPYLTHAGTIVSGKRLEAFLSEVGSFESPYYDNKKDVELETNRRIRNADKKWGHETLPSDEVLQSKEEADRARFREMMIAGTERLQNNNNTYSVENGDDNFTPVLSSFTPEIFQPSEGKDDKLEPGLNKRLGNLLMQSVSGATSDGSSDSAVPFDDQDLKGRYYYDKFQFTPFDAAEHKALRKAYIEGLVWNLKYYYEGCVSWSWYFPYHYGPMISDLVNIDEMLEEVSFEGKLGSPLKPFEQLMACMPPSQAHVLPKPYRSLMTSPDSTIIDFYPRAFTVDMNGKRWPWEAVVLLPFIDTDRLLESTREITEHALTPEEKNRNQLGNAIVMTSDASKKAHSVKMENFESTEWCSEQVGFQPELKPGTVIPLPGLPTLRSAPIRSMWRSRLGLDVFGMPSRYKTACLEHSNAMPTLPSLENLGQALIGSTIWINYPHLTEAFVTAVSDETHHLRGKETTPRRWSKADADAWRANRNTIVTQYEKGQGFTGTGGLLISPKQDVILSVRPLKSLRKMSDGTTVKTFSKTEIDVPIVATFWSPPQPDPRVAGIPSLLEKDPYKIREIKVEMKESVKEEKNNGKKKRSDKKKVAAAPARKEKHSQSSKDQDAKARKNPALTVSTPLQTDPPTAFIETGASTIPATLHTEKVKMAILPSEQFTSAIASGEAPPVVSTPSSSEGGVLILPTMAHDTPSLVSPLGSGDSSSPAYSNDSSRVFEPLNVLPNIAATNENGAILPTFKLEQKTTEQKATVSKKKKKRGKARANVENGASAPPSLSVLPAMPTYKDVSTPITEKVSSQAEIVLMDAPPSQSEAMPKEAVPPKAPILPGRTIPKEDPSLTYDDVAAKGMVLHKASNGKWWDQLAKNKHQSSVSRNFSSLAQLQSRNHGNSMAKKMPRAHHILHAGNAATTSMSGGSARYNLSTTAPIRVPRSSTASSGGGRGRIVAAGLAAAAYFMTSSGVDGAVFETSRSVQQKVPGWFQATPTQATQTPTSLPIFSDEDLTPLLFLRGGESYEERTVAPVPPLEFAHGTTTLSFVFQGGAIVAVDSRASMGSFVGSKTVQKVLPINSHMLGTMAGGAADCSYLMRVLRSQAQLFELQHDGRRISTARVSSMLAAILYDARGRGAELSVGTMIVGYDDSDNNVFVAPKIFYVDDTGVRLQGTLFSVGSGSTFALAILDTEYRHDMSESEAIALGIKAIRYATFRDAFSGGYINVYVVTREKGWQKVFTQDVATAVLATNTTTNTTSNTTSSSNNATSTSTSTKLD